MIRPYEAYPLRRRYLWAKAERERDGAFRPGIFEVHRRWRWGGNYAPQKHATQQWTRDGRFFRLDHWRFAGSFEEECR